MDGGLQTSRTGLNVASKAEGVVTNYSLELFLLWVVRVVHRTVVTELARRNDGLRQANSRKSTYGNWCCAAASIDIQLRNACLNASESFWLKPIVAS